MEFNETDGGSFLEDEEMMIVWSHDEDIPFPIVIALIVDDMLPFSPHNVLQFIVGVLVHG